MKTGDLGRGLTKPCKRFEEALQKGCRLEKGGLEKERPEETLQKVVVKKVVKKEKEGKRRSFLLAINDYQALQLV